MLYITIETNTMTTSLKECLKNENKTLKWSVECKRNCKGTMEKELIRREIRSHLDQVTCKKESKIGHIQRKEKRVSGETQGFSCLKIGSLDWPS